MVRACGRVASSCPVPFRHPRRIPPTRPVLFCRRLFVGPFSLIIRRPTARVASFHHLPPEKMLLLSLAAATRVFFSLARSKRVLVPHIYGIPIPHILVPPSHPHPSPPPPCVITPDPLEGSHTTQQRTTPTTHTPHTTQLVGGLIMLGASPGRSSASGPSSWRPSGASSAP